MRHTLIAGAISAGLVAWAAAAIAAPPQLKGRYTVTGQTDCLVVIGTAGFNSNLQPIGGYLTSSHSVLAVRTYNGDGTGHVEGQQLTISRPGSTGGAGASSHTFSFDFTYAFVDKGVFTTQMVPGSFQGTFLTGPRAGQTYTNDKLSLMGVVSGDKKVLDVASVTPEIETVSYSNGDIHRQICTRSRVHTFLGE